jgi:choline dehydrogenase-like flavoprotein
VSPERLDVCIVGSGFGGSIAAWRLAELYRAVEQDASVVVLERGLRKGHRDFRQSMDVEHLSDVYGLIQGRGAQIVVANLVGGGSNLYLAASLRSPSETFERTDTHPDDGPRRRMWPQAISRRSLNRYYARAEAALRVRQPSWNEVSKSGGVWAAMLREAGHTCDRVPLAIDFGRCVDAKWCYTGCVFGAKNSLITNYLAAAERKGVEVRPLVRVDEVRPSSARPYRWLVRGVKVDPATKTGTEPVEIECKVAILAAGAMGTPPILLRSRNNGALSGISPHLGKHLGVNGDHIAAIEINPGKAGRVLGLRGGYDEFHKGKPITTMTYDHWVGKRGNAHDGTRFTLQEILLSQLTNFLYDDGRGDGSEPSWWGREKKRSISTWSRHIEILAMVEETMDGEFYAVPPTGNGHVQPNGGPVGIGLFNYTLSDQSARVRQQADAAIKQIAERRGVGRFLRLAETPGVYASHPLGGARMADDIAFGVTDDGGEVFGHEGLFCMDSSLIPTSFGVNPSLSISAVCERAAAKLVARAADFDLPRRPPGFRHRPPGEHVGPRVVPGRR